MIGCTTMTGSVGSGLKSVSASSFKRDLGVAYSAGIAERFSQVLLRRERYARVPGSSTFADLIFLNRWLPSDLPPLSTLSLGLAVGGGGKPSGAVDTPTETGKLSGTSSPVLPLSLHFTGGVCNAVPEYWAM